MKVLLWTAEEFSFLGNSSIAHFFIFYHNMKYVFEDNCIYIKSNSYFTAQKKLGVAPKLLDLLLH